MPLKMESGCFRAGDELHMGEVRVSMEVEGIGGILAGKL